MSLVLAKFYNFYKISKKILECITNRTKINKNNIILYILIIFIYLFIYTTDPKSEEKNSLLLPNFFLTNKIQIIYSLFKLMIKFTFFTKLKFVWKCLRHIVP